MKTPLKRTLISAGFLCAALFLAHCKGTTEQAPYGSDLTAPQGVFVGKPTAVDVSSTPLHGACPTGTGTIDSRLQAGMVFESNYKTINGTKANKTLSVRSRIISAAPTRLEERAMPTAASGVNSAQVDSETPWICSYDSNNSASCTVPSFITEMSPTASGDFDKCELTGPDASKGSTSALYGPYKLSGGAVVNAYQIITTYEGDLECSGRSKGPGKRVEIVTLTNDVPNEGAASACGGTRLFNSSVFQTKFGAVLFGSSMERTVIPAAGAPTGSPAPLPSPVSSPGPNPSPSDS